MFSNVHAPSFTTWSYTGVGFSWGICPGCFGFIGQSHVVNTCPSCEFTKLPTRSGGDRFRCFLGSEQRAKPPWHGMAWGTSKKARGPRWASSSSSISPTDRGIAEHPTAEWGLVLEERACRSRSRPGDQHDAMDVRRPSHDRCGDRCGQEKDSSEKRDVQKDARGI